MFVVFILLAVSLQVVGWGEKINCPYAPKCTPLIKSCGSCGYETRTTLCNGGCSEWSGCVNYYEYGTQPVDLDDNCYSGTYRDYYCMGNSEIASYNEIITDKDNDGYDIECEGDHDDSNKDVHPYPVVYGSKRFDRTTGAPDEYSESFELESGNYIVNIENHGVSSARVSLNGVEIASPSDFTKNSKGMKIPVSLQSQNSFDIELKIESKPGSYIVIYITGPNKDEGGECDDLDNDLDGIVDEGCDCVDGETKQCGTTDLGNCQYGTQTCSNGQWGDCVGNIEPTVEICDGIDNDCDGVSDSNEGLTRICGTNVGVCSYGIQHCTDSGWGICLNNIEPSSELCDNLDNDCDGLIDEGVKNAYYQDSDSDGYGSSLTQQACSAPLGYTTQTGDCDDANAVINPSAIETCNGMDDDCDGTIDEGCNCIDGDTQSQSCGQGACSGGTQTRTCSNGNWGSWSTCSTANKATTETCNNVDDDCDGSVDESLTQSCGSDVGECVSGTQTCNSGSWSSCSGSYVAPTTEICDGKDNNCDGTVDEGCNCIDGQTQQCGTTNIGACKYGTQTCTNGNWGSCTGNIEPAAETCNNIDDDCDNLIDENFDLNNDVNNCGSCGNICSYSNAQAQCLSGTCQMILCLTDYHDLNSNPSDGCEYGCAITNGGIEFCDSVDNNCDGNIDENNVCNNAPSLDLIGNKTVNENNLLEFNISANDPDGDNLTYSAQNLPSGATFINHKFSWIPSYAQSGTYTVTFNVTDSYEWDSETIIITVINVNRASQWNFIPGNQLINEDTSLSYDVNASDPDGDAMIYYVNDSLFNIDVNGTITWTPDANWNGIKTIKITASDGSLNTTADITVIVNPVNDAPTSTVQLPTITINEEASNTTINLSNYFNDVDNTTLIYTVSSNETNLNATIYNNEMLDVTGLLDWYGTALITVNASDGQYIAQNITTVTVNNINDAPVVSGLPNITFDEDSYNDSLNNLTIYVSDVDNLDSEINWSAVGQTNITVTINNFAKSANFTALANWYGSELITLIATDPSGLNDNQTINVTVVSVNDAPVINSWNVSNNKGWSTTTQTNITTEQNLTLIFTENASDIDLDTIFYYWYLDDIFQDNITSWNWPVSFITKGQHNVTLVVSDGLLNDSQLWFIDINDTFSPVITIINPINQWYTSQIININATTNENSTSCWYELNNSINGTLTGANTVWNTTTNTTSDGLFTLTVYCNDTATNTGNVSTIFFVDSIKPTINHTAITDAKTDDCMYKGDCDNINNFNRVIDVLANVSDIHLQQVTLFYRVKPNTTYRNYTAGHLSGNPYINVTSDGLWKSTAMTNISGNIYKGTIPNYDIPSDSVIMQYYIEANDSAGNIQRFTNVTSPLEIQMRLSRNVITGFDLWENFVADQVNSNPGSNFNTNDNLSGINVDAFIHSNGGPCTGNGHSAALFESPGNPFNYTATLSYNTTYDNRTSDKNTLEAMFMNVTIIRDTDREEVVRNKTQYIYDIMWC